MRATQLGLLNREINRSRISGCFVPRDLGGPQLRAMTSTFCLEFDSTTSKQRHGFKAFLNRDSEEKERPRFSWCPEGWPSTQSYQTLPNPFRSRQSAAPTLSLAYGEGLNLMILRAAFWIAVVAVFIPREPDIGYGRPSVPSMVPPKTAAWIAETFKVPPCAQRPHCTNGSSPLSGLRQAVLVHLERAKADLKASTPPSTLARRIMPD